MNDYLRKNKNASEDDAFNATMRQTSDAFSKNFYDILV
jgi:hypothetical protein